ncbi:hypothetical protein HPB49_008565 [Dermacentor silvarum]|uniref:Uncharacterized protein n=1 Tax=Dermacentor silvarum TaxID=543639 RepID=A0ACB8DXB5_DERSI|nr:hypothetical protein HPB49_008565 [Dermacentor silvarum]
MDVVSVEGEYITKEYAEEPGWHTVGKGKQANVESGVPGNKDQGKRLLSEVLARNKCTKGQKVRQVILASKMPNLPKEDYKIIMRPRGGFKVTNYGLDRLGCCVRNAAGIPRGESEGDIVCVNYKQNILVVSTPSDDRAAKYRHITSLKIGNEEFDTSAYEAAPENTSKGIIRGISLEESPKDIWENLVSWANAVSGARAGAEAASQSKIRELEKELAQIRQMMVQYNQSNAALKEENRKLKEENNRIRKGMAENREVTQVVAEEREIDMEEDVATPAKRKATEDTVGNSEKKTKPVSALPERQEEVEQRIEAKIEEMGARIMQQIQQQLNSIVTRIADIETRIAAWGPQSSGGGPIKTTGKPYIKPPVLTEGAGKL